MQPQCVDVMRGKSRLRSFLLGILLILWAMPVPALAQFEVEQEKPFWFRGLLDVRIAGGGRAPSWTDKGPGKSRYGGRSTARGFEQVTRLSLAQLALEAGATLPWGVTAHAQLNWETDIDNDDRPLLIEAFLRKEWGEWEKGWGIQTGIMNAPFSLEHRGPAVTPLYTLTPSALNTWIWEEARIVGIEGDWWRVMQNGARVRVLLGSGFGPDQLGRLLALRGWVFSDGVSGVNSDLTLPQRVPSSSVFDERDHRPAIYALFTLSDERERAELKLGYFDTLGDRETTGVWETRFGTVGAIVRPFGRVELLAQYLEGAALVYNSAADVGFSAFYTLLSVGYRGHRLSARYDLFRTTDLDGAPFLREHGDGITLAYLFEFGLHHRVGVEYIFLHSRRPALFPGDPADGGWQLSYRFRY